jgi:hypothetical protein
MSSLVERKGFKFKTICFGISQAQINYNMRLDNVTANFPEIMSFV